MAAKEFNTAVVRFTDLLKPFAISLTKDINDAEDLMQDTILRALKYRDKYRHDTNLKAWLSVMMRNIFINNYRKKSVRKQNSVDTSEESYKIDAKHKVDNRAESNLVMEDVYTAIHALPKEYETTLLMNYRGYKYQEIADALSIPLGTVKSRIFWARKKLSENLSVYRMN